MTYEMGEASGGGIAASMVITDVGLVEMLLR